MVREQLPEDVRVHWSMRNDLYAVDGVIIKNNKILIPKQLRREVLESLHSAHQGVTGMTSNARQRLFWPGLDSQLRLIRSQCKDCNDVISSNAREPIAEAPLGLILETVEMMGKCHLNCRIGPYTIFCLWLPRVWDNTKIPFLEFPTGANFLDNDFCAKTGGKMPFFHIWWPIEAI